MLSLSFEECISNLETSGKPTYPAFFNNTVWCNATWDSVLCWPAVRAGTSHTSPCPPLRGLNSEKFVTKHCHASGRWLGRNETDFSQSHGYTDYLPCMQLNSHILEASQEIARTSRIIEYTGMIFSFFALLIALFHFRKLQNCEHVMRKQFMKALLLLTVIRFLLYMDLGLKHLLGGLFVDYGSTFFSWKIVCEIMYGLLEVMKLAPVTFLCLKAYCLYRSIVWNHDHVAKPNKFVVYKMIGWGLPFCLISIWLVAYGFAHGEIPHCLGSYYIERTYWIPFGSQILGLITTCILTVNALGVLYCRSYSRNEAITITSSKRNAWIMIILILVITIPAIINSIPWMPTQQNLAYFRAIIYTSSVLMGFQGFSVALVFFLWDNEKEVMVASPSLLPVMQNKDRSHAVTQTDKINNSVD